VRRLWDGGVARVGQTPMFRTSNESRIRLVIMSQAYVYEICIQIGQHIDLGDS